MVWHDSPSVARAPPSEWPQQRTLLGSCPPDSCLMTSARLSFGLAMELTAANCCMKPAAQCKQGLVSCLMGLHQAHFRQGHRAVRCNLLCKICTTRGSQCPQPATGLVLCMLHIISFAPVLHCSIGEQ